MGNPLFKASDGDRFGILRVSEDVTESELRKVLETQVLTRSKARPCLRRSGFAQAGRSFSDRLTHVGFLFSQQWG